jgi:1,4-alpha-glucan branching enzyme
VLTKRYFKTKDEVEVTFEVDAPELDSAEWVAETTDWEPIEMRRTDRGKGPFRLKVRLPRDRAVQFRYILDGWHWENDDAADAYWPNEYGSDNSVVLTHA